MTHCRQACQGDRLESRDVISRDENDWAKMRDWLKGSLLYYTNTVNHSTWSILESTACRGQYGVNWVQLIFKLKLHFNYWRGAKAWIKKRLSNRFIYWKSRVRGVLVFNVLNRQNGNESLLTLTLRKQSRLQSVSTCIKQVRHVLLRHLSPRGTAGRLMWGGICRSSITG